MLYLEYPSLISPWGPGCRRVARRWRHGPHRAPSRDRYPHRQLDVRFQSDEQGHEDDGERIVRDRVEEAEAASLAGTLLDSLSCERRDGVR